MSDWVSGSDLAIFFVGFLIYNLIDRYLGRIEKAVLTMKSDLINMRTSFESGPLNNLGASLKTIQGSLSSMENSLTEMTNSLTEVKGDTDFFRRITVQKLVDEVVRNNDFDAAESAD